MIDYYSNLLRAVTAPGAGDAQWRRRVYARTREMLAKQIRARRPPLPLRQVAAEQSALEAAIERVEAEVAFARAAPADADAFAEGDIAAGTRAEAGTMAATMTGYGQSARGASPLPGGSVPWIAAAIVVAALGAGGYLYVARPKPASAPATAPAPAQQAQMTPAPAAPAPAKPAAPASRGPTAGKDGDLPPGVDGGASDPDQPYVYRRQPTFYRTLQPVGSVIVDKLQHFLYVIQPNSVALRYGIGLGDDCRDLVGVRHVATMAEWPSWQPGPDVIRRRLAGPGPMAGGPGNPLGARSLELDDSVSRINGTNAPKTIGTSVAFGCIRLTNDDITDLYGRVKAGTLVFID